MTSPINEDYCRIDEAADILGVHRSQLSRYIDRGYLKAERVGNQLFLLRTDVEGFSPPGQGRRDFEKVED